MSGSTTVLDNTNSGTAELSGWVSVRSPYYDAYNFTTAGTSTWEIAGILLGLSGNTATTFTLNLGLYASTGSVPTGTALTSVSLSVALTTTAGYYSFDATALGTLANYTMAAGTAYALVASNPSTTLTVRWAGVSPSAQPTAYAGFTNDGLAFSNNSGASWNTSGSTPAFSLLVDATCFLRGTLILTSRGEVAVERLREGDLVATRFGGLRPIRWIGTQRFHPRFAGPASTPVRFAPGSLGNGIPSTALFVSPGHAMLVGDVLAHAGALVNGSTIAQPRFEGESIDYFHLDLGGHDCVLANSAWAESYFEDHNRDSFHNAADFHARFPEHQPHRQATCLPIVTAEHPQIAAVLARLAPEAMREAA